MPLDLDRSARVQSAADRDFALNEPIGVAATGVALVRGDTSAEPVPLGTGNPGQALRDRVRSLATPATQRLTSTASHLGSWLYEQWARVRPRRGLKSLYWRILIFNLLGLVALLISLLYLSTQQDWLIEAKRESIQAQAQVIADAIVREATSDEPSPIFPDPDRLLDRGSTLPIETRSYNVQNLEFAIQPEKVAPILQRYSQSSGQRARIYARDGTLIYDSAGLLNRGAHREQPASALAVDPAAHSLRSRISSFFMPSSLPIYREIGRGNGRAYAEVEAALDGIAMPMLMVNDRGSHMVSVAIPIRRSKIVQGALLLSTREGDIDGIRRKERHLILWIFVVASIATALTTLALAGTIARPMRKLSDAAHAVQRNIKAAKDLPRIDNKDEIGQLAVAFRGMTLALYKRIELSEKFAADVAHELKNPVAAVRSATESLCYVKDEKDRNELIETIQTDLKRLNKLITDIWNFSRLDAELSLSEAEPVDIGALTQGVAATFNDMRGTAANPEPVSVTLPSDLAGQCALLVNGHETRLGQVLTNLVDNALSFSAPEARVHVGLDRIDGRILLTVEDEGPGIPEDRFEQIFVRFYTDRPDSEATQGKNSGLGLSITREIVTAHAGTIAAENRLGDDGSTILGARFVVVLPALGAGGSDETLRGTKRG